MNDDLEKKLEAAAEYVRNLTPEQYEEMIRRQAQSYALSEASWPKPKYKWVDGVKVYESYADYLAD